MTLLASGMFAIGIILANVPQGLMPTLTLALAMAVQGMAKSHALIKNFRRWNTGLYECHLYGQDRHAPRPTR